MRRLSTAAAGFAVILSIHLAPARAADVVEGGSSGATANPQTDSLKKAIATLRDTAVGAERIPSTYLDRIEAGQATAPQVNDFAAYVTKRGMPRLALEFQEYAVRLDATDDTLWLNLGTIRRAAGAHDGAETAFKKAIAIDPGNALAHYNLGSIYDADKKYDDAIEEYRRALVLDPNLGDPRKNPQVVNNENLLAVKLEIYQTQAGSLGLPLLQMQKPAPPPKPAAPPAAAAPATPPQKR